MIILVFSLENSLILFLKINKQNFSKMPPRNVAGKRSLFENPLPEHLRNHKELPKNVTLQVGDKKFKVNKEIVEIFSPVIKAMLSDVWLPAKDNTEAVEAPKKRTSGRAKRSVENKVETFVCDLPEQAVDPEVVPELIWFFNNGGTIPFKNDNAHSLLMAADYLDVSFVRRESEQFLTGCVSIDTILPFYKVASELGLKYLLEACRYFIEKNRELIREMFQELDRHLTGESLTTFTAELTDQRSTYVYCFRNNTKKIRDSIFSFIREDHSPLISCLKVTTETELEAETGSANSETKWKASNMTFSSYTPDSGASVGDKIYLFSDDLKHRNPNWSIRDQLSVNQLEAKIEVLDCRSGEVKMITTMPTLFDGFLCEAIAELDGYLYALCSSAVNLYYIGRKYPFEFQECFQRYCLATDTWETVPGIDQTDREHPTKLVALEGNLYLIGANKGFSQCYNPSTQVWSRLPEPDSFSQLRVPSFQASNICYRTIFSIEATTHYGKIYFLDGYHFEVYCPIGNHWSSLPDPIRGDRIELNSLMSIDGRILFFFFI